MGKPRLEHLKDEEGVVHFSGASQCVNPGLCGNNSQMEVTLDEVNCFGCLAQLRHIYAHAKGPPMTDAPTRELVPVTQEGAPIPMVLYCPKCGVQHIDAASEGWDNPPHRSHLCHACGCVWRPADVPTTGVAAISTTGQADTWGWDGASLNGATSAWSYRAGLEAAAKVAEANTPITIYPGSYKIETACQLISEQIRALAQQDGGEG